ncbi:MAG: transposase [Mariprofundus sp.]
MPCRHGSITAHPWRAWIKSSASQPRRPCPPASLYAGADIYLSDDDRELFLDVLGHVVDRFGWSCHAYCLMSKHFHLMIETPQANLSRGMRQLNGMYTQRFNRKHGRAGHVFQGRFKSIVVDKEAYLLALSRYIVRNPVAAGIVQNVGAWPWSSYQATAGEVSAPEFLDIVWLLSQFGGEAELARTAYADFIRKEDTTSPWDSLNGPDILGNDAFRGRLQKQRCGLAIGIPKRKQLLRHLPLSDIARTDRERSDWMREAYREHGYTMQEIATFARLHHSTVSRIIKTADEHAQNKS